MNNENNITIWKISPGEKGSGWGDCLRNGTIGIGWAHEKNIHGLDEKEIEEYARKKYTSDEKPGYIAKQLIHFIFHIKKGHIIIAYSSPSTIYGIGIVEDDEWKYDKNVDSDDYWLRNTRKINWIKSSKQKIDDVEIISKLGIKRTIIPVTKKLFEDKILPLYPRESFFNLFEIDNENNLHDFFNIEEDEQCISDESFEEKKKLRYHKLIERNSNLSKRTKEIHGYTCIACGFNFIQKYGEIGTNYIEAHHLIPFSDLNENSKVSPKNDMTVLCANCHRMIHRLQNVSNIEEFKKIIH